MAALTKDRLIPDTTKINPNSGSYVIDYAVEGAAKIYKGSFVRISASGHAEPCAGTSTEPCLGVALEAADNTNGADGDITVKVEVGAVWVHDVTSTTVANIGDAVYCSDDQTLVLTSITNEFFGRIVQFIAGDQCIVVHEFPGTPAA